MPKLRSGPFHGRDVSAHDLQHGGVTIRENPNDDFGHRYERTDEWWWDYLGRVAFALSTPGLDAERAQATAGTEMKVFGRGPQMSSVTLDVAGQPQFVLEKFHNPHSGYAWEEVAVLGHDGAPRVFKAILHPGAYLIAQMQTDPAAIEEFLADHRVKDYRPAEDGGSAEHLVEVPGRLCYWSFNSPRPGGLAKFLDNLKREAHGSVFEHPHFSFLITGVSRNLTLELNRHRPLSISQLSGRYCDADVVGFVPDVDDDADDRGLWAARCAEALAEYERKYDKNYARQRAKQEARWRAEVLGLTDGKGPGTDKAAQLPRKYDTLAIKRARERARDILPGALETRAVYTVNARAARFIFERRCAPDAGWEIRRAMNGVFRLMRAAAPGLFDDLREHPMDDGTFAVVADNPKI